MNFNWLLTAPGVVTVTGTPPGTSDEQAVVVVAITAKGTRELDCSLYLFRNQQPTQEPAKVLRNEKMLRRNFQLLRLWFDFLQSHNLAPRAGDHHEMPEILILSKF